MKMKVANSSALLSMVAVLLASVAVAQTPPKPSTAAPAAPTVPKPPAAAAPTAPKPLTLSSAVVGTWTGQVQQVGRGQAYPISITIDAAGGVTSYSEQGCAGKLTRVSGSGPYGFYAEKITKGGYNSATGMGCLDGTMILTRAGTKLFLSWFGVVDSTLYQASATLAGAAPKL
jgi:hypothetical protein